MVSLAPASSEVNGSAIVRRNQDLIPLQSSYGSEMADSSVPRLRKALKVKPPNLLVESELWGQGHNIVVGIDEVGRGAWAGPLTIGAVVAPQDRRIYKLRDSKALTEPEREAMFGRIVGWSQAHSVGHAMPMECDRLGMSGAQKLAARRAIEGLGLEVDAVILDGNWDFVGHRVTRKLVKGDTRCVSIAAASILAKVTRDRLMRTDAHCYPGFDFDRNKGYPCPRHKMALQAYGPTAIHRRSWAFMDALCWSGARRLAPGGQSPLFY